MEKLGRLIKCSNRATGGGNGWRRDSMVYRCPAASLSTLTTTPPRITSTGRNLYKRLARVGNPNPRASILPILDQWVEEEGRTIDRTALLSIVARFQKSRRLHHCLQILQWTSDKNVANPSLGDVSFQLELIFMVHGIEQAEVYFNHVPETLRVSEVYSSLLRCCVKANELEKAETTLQKMKELGYATSWSYNVMLTLYHKLGDGKKIDILVQEMKEKGINCDRHMYNIRLKAYLAYTDLEKIEMLLLDMEADPLVTMDWNIYASAANAYIKAGAPEKAFTTLKKSERVIRGDKMFAYGVITTLYANLGKREEVYRIWNLNKKQGRFYNKAYLLMVNSLAKLDDLDGAEKILEEWEARKEYFDHRLPRILIKAYCEKGLMVKAELIMKKLIENGNEPSPHTWCLMAMGYLIANQVDKAVEALKKEISASTEPTEDLITSASCLEYLDRIDAGEEIVKSLQEKGLFTRTVYEKLRITLVRNNKDPLQVVRWKGMIMTWS